MSDIEKIINDAWENKNQVSQNSDKSIIDSINIWVNDMTYGLIKDIVSEQDVKRTTKQVLVNTLHFKSKCALKC